jgi:hypothetical protein
MQVLLDFLRDNAGWLLGGGGVSALLLEWLKRGGDTSITVNAPVGGDVVGRDKTVHAGPGPWGALQALAAVVALTGAAAWLLL